MERFSPSSKNKKIYPEKMELSSSNIETFLIFSQKKAFLIVQKTETLRNSYISEGTSKIPETKISDISPKNVMNAFF